jgi:glutamate-ammonia-ligase adenylyltransferase
LSGPLQPAASPETPAAGLSAEAGAELEAWSLAAAVAFEDRRAARLSMQRLAARLRGWPELPVFLSRLAAALEASARPDQALVNFERLFESALEPAGLLEALSAQRRTLEILATLFAGSQFLTEILLRNPDYLQQLGDYRQLARPKEVEQLYQEAFQQAFSHEAYIDRLEAARRFQKRELLRIGVCDLLDLYDFPTAALQLSNLADSLIQLCLEIASAESPRAKTDLPGHGLAVLALGKLGGQELNYSSDIDLLFIGSAAAEGPAEDLQRLGKRLIDALGRVTAEGFLYRVDMRLRPWGGVGQLVNSLAGYQVYLEKHARLWEKQALLKARLVAGERAAGQQFLERIAPHLLHHPDPARVRAEVQAMKQRTEDHLRQQGRSWGEVKLGEGSIRDVEFSVQYLQLACGASHPAILTPNTLEALASLAQAGLLTQEQARVLDEGYVFLRTVEHYLQIMDYQQSHTLPASAGELAGIARRLGFVSPQAAVLKPDSPGSGEQFLARYRQNCQAIRRIYMEIMGNQLMPDSRSTPSVPPNQLANHLARMHTSYSAAFSASEIAQHAWLASNLGAGRLAEVDVQPLEAGFWRITIVAFDYPGLLSIICGLLLVYRLNINDGYAFTYEPLAGVLRRSPAPEVERRKIVDVFTVQPAGAEVNADLWQQYAADLRQLLGRLENGDRRGARGELARRVGLSLSEAERALVPLYPIEIEIDNSLSERYTVLRILSQDTLGFLYELTNALALQRVSIDRMTVESIGERVYDTLFVTDERGRKIIAPERQRELRAAVVLIKHFTHLLPFSADPEAALRQFRALIDGLFQSAGWPDEVASLDRPEVLQALAQLLGVSSFLWEDFLRMQYANLFPVVRDVAALQQARTKEQLRAELAADLPPLPDPAQAPPAGAQPDSQAWRTALNAFKDRAMFRVDMRSILGLIEAFDDFSHELTDLAEVVVEAACHYGLDELYRLHGRPYLEDGSPDGLVVCALGKCGGRELGFASDIELMFIYAGKGQTSGPQVISAAEFYEKLVAGFLGTIQARREGIFEIDLQLRPYGKAGSLAVSLDAFRRYFAPQGPAWAYERQALVKLRPIAGDEQAAALGAQVTALRDAFVYTGEPFDVTAMRAMRERQVRHLVARGTFNAKYSPGGLLDLEYLVQGLQITHGHANPALRATNTRQALAALAEQGLISPQEHTRLRKSLTFLRWLINTLRVVRGNAKDLTVPPIGSEESKYLARRLRYGNDLERLRSELARYTTDVQELNRRLLG